MKTPLYTKASKAFTLVELLVVIGIIALLISILLPVIGKVREQGTTVKCQSNLRQIHIALSSYAAENKGSLPWGFIWEHPETVLPGQNFPSSGGQKFSVWASSLARYLNVKRPEVGLAGDYAQRPPNSNYYDMYSEAMRCPAIDQQYGQFLSYSILPTAMPNWKEEKAISGLNGLVELPLLKPAKFSDLYSDNTIAWDGPAWSKLDRVNPMEWADSSFIYGGLGAAGYSYIDAGKLYTDEPEVRFRNKSYDPFAINNPPNVIKHKMQSYPIDIFRPTFYPNSNTDINGDNIQFGQSGVPRFRHNRDTVCNALVADGSVRSFVANFKTPKAKAYVGETKWVETDWLRRYIMIHYP